MRILLLIAIGLMIYIIIKRFLDARAGANQRPDAISSDSTGLVKCDYCGIHVVENEAIQSDRDTVVYYCCVEHETLDIKKHG